MVGVSGGGGVTSMAAAIDPRIRLSFPVAGSAPLYSRNRDLASVGDAEQYYVPLYAEDIAADGTGGGVATWLEIYALGGYGAGRKQIMVTNLFDPCCFSGKFADTFRNIVASKVGALGAGTWEYHRDTTSTAHEISVNTLDTIVLPALLTTGQAVTLSGTVLAGGLGLAGVSFAAAGQDGSCSASDSLGRYSCSVPQGYTGSVTPSKVGYSFTPSSRGYSNVAASQAAQDYAASASVNVALASAGGTASASSTLSPSASFPVASVINGDHTGGPWGNGGGWIDGTTSSFPDWVQLVFNGPKTVDRVVVYSIQDNFANPVEPTDSQTFSLFGVVDFTVDGWNGSAWVTLATVSDNTLVKRSVSFSGFKTDRIRITVTKGLNGYSRLAEVEAWGR
jgi:hypothetical protein